MSASRQNQNDQQHADEGKAAWLEPAVIRLHAGEAEGVDGTGTDTSSQNS